MQQLCPMPPCTLVNSSPEQHCVDLFEVEGAGVHQGRVARRINVNSSSLQHTGERAIRVQERSRCKMMVTRTGVLWLKNDHVKLCYVHKPLTIKVYRCIQVPARACNMMVVVAGPSQC